MASLLTLLVLIVAAAILIPLMLSYSTFNRIMALDARCDTGSADVDVHLKHRHNLIPGLVETV